MRKNMLVAIVLAVGVTIPGCVIAYRVSAKIAQLEQEGEALAKKLRLAETALDNCMVPQ